MDDQVSKRKLYKIPPNNISDNRRKFYDLKADNDEWISRLFDHIYDCDYPKGGEYILTDKYMCELKPEERDTVCEADLNWSTKFLFLNKTTTDDDVDHSNQLKSSAGQIMSLDDELTSGYDIQINTAHSDQAGMSSCTGAEISDGIYYKIPSNNILDHRRKFYGLKKSNVEAIKKWFERVFSYADGCDYPESIKFVLMDKFMSELSNEERDHIRKADSNWSIKSVIQSNKTIDTYDEDHSNELEPSFNMNVGIDDEMMPGNDIQIITEHLDSMALKEDCQTAHQEMSPSAQLQQQQQQQHQSLMSDFTTPSTQKSLLNRQPPVTITKTRVTAKLVINQNRMFIMLMGIRGRKLTKQQLITVYERFKQQLIKKAREQSTRQALGPTEICFVMRPPQMQPLSLVQNQAHHQHKNIPSGFISRYSFRYTKSKLNFCNFCHKAFTQLSHLMEHKKVDHYATEEPVHLQRNLVTHTEDRTHLRKHKRSMHQEIRPHACKQCDARFSSLRALKTHLLTHTGERPHPCDQCDMSFRQTATLANHKKFVHQRIRRFVCGICGSRSATAQNLRKHALTHTGERPYPCDQCDKAFTQTSALELHKRSVHQQIRPYRCSMCNKQCTTAQNLEKHFFTHMK